MKDKLLGMHDAFDRIAARLGLSRTSAGFTDLIDDFDGPTIVSFINYLEKRIESMRGDENPKYVLEQIRRDLSAISVAILNNCH